MTDFCILHDKTLPFLLFTFIILYKLKCLAHFLRFSHVIKESSALLTFKYILCYLRNDVSFLVFNL